MSKNKQIVNQIQDANQIIEKTPARKFQKWVRSGNLPLAITFAAFLGAVGFGLTALFALLAMAVQIFVFAAVGTFLLGNYAYWTVQFHDHGDRADRILRKQSFKAIQKYDEKYGFLPRLHSFHNPNHINKCWVPEIKADHKGFQVGILLWEFSQRRGWVIKSFLEQKNFASHQHLETMDYFHNMEQASKIMNQEHAYILQAKALGTKENQHIANTLQSKMKI